MTNPPPGRSFATAMADLTGFVPLPPGEAIRLTQRPRGRQTYSLPPLDDAPQGQDGTTPERGTPERR